MKMKNQYIIPETKTLTIQLQSMIAQSPTTSIDNPDGSDTGITPPGVGTGSGTDDPNDTARGGSMWSGGDWDEEF
ncbi:MAG: hypothetical protein IJV52_08690 [Prevotella sp.]|nr:hypothetical protein [Prevotella sp.]